MATPDGGTERLRKTVLDERQTFNPTRILELPARAQEMVARARSGAASDNRADPRRHRGFRPGAVYLQLVLEPAGDTTSG